jgi:hypothetical protein
VVTNKNILPPSVGEQGEEEGGSMFLQNDGYHLHNSDEHTLDFHHCENLKYWLQLKNLGCDIKKYGTL